MAGSAHLAKKPVSLVTVQHTDEWVPYGPIEMPKEGFALLALWPRPNEATNEMPKDAQLIRENLRDKPHRMILEHIDVSGDAPTATAETTVIEDGDIWARRWRLPAGVTLETSDPSRGGGQFFIPLQGSIEYQGTEYPRWSTLCVGPQDGRIVIQAGADGANVIGTQFWTQS